MWLYDVCTMIHYILMYYNNLVLDTQKVKNKYDGYNTDCISI